MKQAHGNFFARYAVKASKPAIPATAKPALTGSGVVVKSMLVMVSYGSFGYP